MSVLTERSLFRNPDILTKNSPVLDYSSIKPQSRKRGCIPFYDPAYFRVRAVLPQKPNRGNAVYDVAQGTVLDYQYVFAFQHRIIVTECGLAVANQNEPCGRHNESISSGNMDTLTQVKALRVQGGAPPCGRQNELTNPAAALLLSFLRSFERNPEKHL